MICSIFCKSANNGFCIVFFLCLAYFAWCNKFNCSVCKQKHQTIVFNELPFRVDKLCEHDINVRKARCVSNIWVQATYKYTMYMDDHILREYFSVFRNEFVQHMHYLVKYFFVQKNVYNEGPTRVRNRLNDLKDFFRNYGNWRKLELARVIPENDINHWIFKAPQRIIDVMLDTINFADQWYHKRFKTRHLRESVKCVSCGVVYDRKMVEHFCRWIPWQCLMYLFHYTQYFDNNWLVCIYCLSRSMEFQNDLTMKSRLIDQKILVFKSEFEKHKKNKNKHKGTLRFCWFDTQLQSWRTGIIKGIFDSKQNRCIIAVECDVDFDNWNGGKVVYIDLDALLCVQYFWCFDDLHAKTIYKTHHYHLDDSEHPDWLKKSDYSHFDWSVPVYFHQSSGQKSRVTLVPFRSVRNSGRVWSAMMKYKREQRHKLSNLKKQQEYEELTRAFGNGSSQNDNT